MPLPPSHPTLPCRLCAARILPSTAAKTDGLCLDCHWSEIHRKEHEARESAPGCVACDGSTKVTWTWFDWDRALEGKGEYRKYPRYLERERAVKHGERYHCTRCGAVWYLNFLPRAKRMNLIPAAYVPLFDRWSMKEAVCPDRILEIARRIGGNPIDPYGGGYRDVWIPCSVTTHQSEHLKLAVLRFSDAPPVTSTDDKPNKLWRYRLIDDVADIAPSRFTLPRKVRLRTSRVAELRMGYSPTPVKSKSGKSYILNERPFAFDRDGVAGEDLRLAHPGKDAQLITDTHDGLTVFAADWFDYADELRIPAGFGAAIASWLAWTFRESGR